MPKYWKEWNWDINCDAWPPLVPPQSISWQLTARLTDQQWKCSPLSTFHGSTLFPSLKQTCKRCFTMFRIESLPDIETQRYLLTGLVSKWGSTRSAIYTKKALEGTFSEYCTLHSEYLPTSLTCLVERLLQDVNMDICRASSRTVTTSSAQSAPRTSCSPTTDQSQTSIVILWPITDWYRDLVAIWYKWKVWSLAGVLEWCWSWF